MQAALVDMETWLVDTLRVAVARQAADGLELPWSASWQAFWRPRTIDVSTGQIYAAGDAIILRVSLAELRETPAPLARGAGGGPLTLRHYEPRGRRCNG